MTRTIGDKSNVLIEIWRSFTSLLKAYAAAASLNGVEHGVLALSNFSMNIIVGRTTLNVEYFETLNRGTWSVMQGTNRHPFAEQPREVERGNLDINTDGTIMLDGNTIDIDHAAIHLLGTLTVTASRNEIEVLA